MKDAATIMDGKALAEQWLDSIAVQVRAMDVPLGLAAVCAGDDPGLKAFVKLKQKAAHSVGITFSSYFCDPSAEHATSEQELADTLQYLVADESIHGIFVELPLPADWDRDRMLSHITPEKDVDALTAAAFVPAPAVQALQYLLSEYNVAVAGKRAAVVGHGFLVGAPIARWLRSQGAAVDVIDVDTPEPSRIAGQADIVITGVGRPGLVTGEWVKEGALVVDFGYAKQGEGFAGDVDADSVKKRAGILTPVPGGMGPLVIAAVLENLVTLATR